ncbi:HD-GYP domain-containing protein [Desulfovibrio psychrotolerans]|uniref:HD family phosphohydrolase n=1 Tax=Desulfovibrio psychrotolerans TaxID=415242 RepID=A0A7J0BUX2_9BACT|nr:HD domain-containing phosphohydrolase [Desulfovibrio psychrotolerans]GFM36975.1 HD family phosphohydrolase [Desulfovibrio psychrotolerans]
MASTAEMSAPSGEGGFFSVSPLMIFPSVMGSFSVYLRQGSEYVLYTGAEEVFTERHKRVLYENGVREVFVRQKHKESYTRYVEENLGHILLDDSIPLRERAGLFYKVSAEALEDVFESRLPGKVGEEQYDRIHSFVNQAVRFLCLENSLKAVGEFIAHDYKTYTHCVNVFVYTTTLLQTYGLDEEMLVRCGIGAMLHDVGKTRIPRLILNKPGKLDPDERRIISKHPTLGLASCTRMPLAQEAMNIILFHHEKMNGSGYPAGLMAEEIPLPVRVVTIADIYDALTSDRPYADARRPFEVLELMRATMAQDLDMEVFKRFIMMLSGARLVGL